MHRKNDSPKPPTLEDGHEYQDDAETLDDGGDNGGAMGFKIIKTPIENQQPVGHATDISPNPILSMCKIITVDETTGESSGHVLLMSAKYHYEMWCWQGVPCMQHLLWVSCNICCGYHRYLNVAVTGQG